MRIHFFNRRTAALFILLGCTIVAVLFWLLADGYRAVAPLIFILGVVGALVCSKQKIRNPFTIHREKLGSLKDFLDTKRFDRQEKLLWKKEIPQIITGLYLQHIRHYPERREQAPDIVPPSITAAVITREGFVKIILNFNEYQFQFEDRGDRGSLKLLAGTQTALSLALVKKFDEYSERWVAHEVEDFSIGPWLKDFKALADETIAIIKRQAKEALEN